MLGDDGNTFSLYVLSTFNGFVQHAVWNQVGGSLTNISSCGLDLAEDTRYLNSVHTTAINGYPSTIVLRNTGARSATADINVFAAASGAFLGTWTSEPVLSGAVAMIEADAIATDLGYRPLRTEYHINMELDEAFPGYALHVVNNEAGGLLTDMSAKCNLDAVVLED